MAFEDLQKAFIEVELEKLREKDSALKPKGKAKLAKGKNAAKGKKKIDPGKKLALTKGLDKSKEKVKLKELEKQRIEAEKTAEEEAKKEAKQAEKDDDKGQKVLSSPSSYGADTETQVDLSIYQQKFYLPEDKDRVSSLDQLETINKLPTPQEQAAPKEEKEVQKEDKQANAKDRFKQLREALGGGVVSASSLAPPKTPITAEVKAAKAAAAKDSKPSMNALLALHSNKS